MSGGGRRLNVLITRARERVHLITSIPPQAYNTLPSIPQGQSPGGGYLLFAYLQFAESLKSPRIPSPSPSPRLNSNDPPNQQISAQHAPTVTILPSRTPSLFAQALARQLSQCHQIPSDVHWGNEGFLIDLALRNPLQPASVTSGILVDACRYDADDDPIDWDLFRTSVHESQGWKLHRLWTPHFFRDPSGVLRFLASQAA